MGMNAVLDLKQARFAHANAFPGSRCSASLVTRPFSSIKQRAPRYRPQLLSSSSNVSASSGAVHASAGAAAAAAAAASPQLPRLNFLNQPPKAAGACEGVELIIGNTASGYWLKTLTGFRGWPVPIWPLVLYSIFSVLAVWVMKTRFKDVLTNAASAKAFAGLQWSVQLVGTALFFLLTFRVNNSYQRWWEGANLWSQVTSVCFGIGRIVRGGNIRNKRLSRRLLRAVMSYVITLQASLHKVDAITNLSDILTAKELQELQQEPHNLRPQLSLQMMQMAMRDAYADGAVESCVTIELNQACPLLTNAMRSMRRISTTPMPFAYIAHLRMFLLIWLAVLPVVFSYSLGYTAIGCCVVIGYALLGMEAICLEVEFPFGRDFSDLPVHKMNAEILEVLLAAYTSTAQLDALPNCGDQEDRSALGMALDELSHTT